MPPPPYRPRSLTWQVFRGTDALTSGLLTAHQLRSSAWVRLSQDVYADARVDHDHRLRCEAVRLWVPPGVAIAGPSAAYLHGVEHAASYADDVHLVAPPDLRVAPRRGVRMHQATITPEELASIGGLTCTTPQRTAWDVACWLEPARAVSIIDMLLRLGVTDRAALLRLARSRAGRRGSRRAACAFDLSDARAQSPPESVLRVRLVRAGLPRPTPQHPVRLPNGYVYHPDLPWPEYRVAIEYDGLWHGADADQHHRDRRRLNQLVAAGWIILHVTSRRLQREFPGIVREARQALRSRGWRG